MANKFNEIRLDEASPEKAGVGGSIPSLATIQINKLEQHESSTRHPPVIGVGLATRRAFISERRIF
jgi:hypothetical protein